MKLPFIIVFVENIGHHSQVVLHSHNFVSDLSYEDKSEGFLFEIVDFILSNLHLLNYFRFHFLRLSSYQFHYNIHLVQGLTRADVSFYRRCVIDYYVIVNHFNYKLTYFECGTVKVKVIIRVHSYQLSIGKTPIFRNFWSQFLSSYRQIRMTQYVLD